MFLILTYYFVFLISLLDMVSLDYAEDPDTLTCGQKSRNNGAVPYMFGSATSYAGKWPFMVSLAHCHYKYA